MNMQTAKSKQGFSLGIAMVYIAIITSIIASVTNLILTEYRATRNSAAYIQALYAAEAGIDLALCEFNLEAQGQTAWAGWTKDGTSYSLGSSSAGLDKGSTFMPEFNVAADISSMKITAAGRATLTAKPLTVSRNLAVTLKRNGQKFVIQTWEEPWPGK